MKRIHLLCTTSPAGVMAELIAALTAAGLRSGWLDLATGDRPAAAPDAPEQPDATEPTGRLAPAADAGALRAVHLDGGHAVTVKPLAGPPVLRDLLREHFLGCAVVLVRRGPGGAFGDDPPAAGSLSSEVAGLPRIEPAGDRWRVTLPGGEATGDEVVQELATDRLCARLRRPRPWASSPSGPAAAGR